MWFYQYHKFLDRQIWENSADPDQTAPSLIRVYTVCNSLCIFWMHYSKEKPSCSTFRVIKANFRFFTVMCPAIADGMANSVDLYQTVPLALLHILVSLNT